MLIYFFNCRIDVIEGQWTIIIVHLITSLCGQQFWSEIIVFQFSGIQFTLLTVLWLLTCCTLIWSQITNLMTAFDQWPTPLDRFVKIPRNQHPIRFNPLILAVILTGISLWCFFWNDNQLYTTNPLLFILTFGLAFAKLTFRLQVSLFTSFYFNFLIALKLLKKISKFH